MTPRCSAGANSALVPCPGRSCQCVSELDLPAVGAVAREGALTDEQGGLLRCSRGTDARAASRIQLALVQARRGHGANR